VFTATIDGDDRFQHRFGTQVRPLAPAEYDALRRRIHDCWHLLVRYHTPTAQAIGTGPVTLVPLTEPATGRSYSATSGWTFGAIALTPPVDALSLAVTLVHEFHHLVLGAVEDIVPLVRLTSRALCYAPWRDDPRPLGGLLQGTFAHLAMLRFWRRHRAAGPPEHRRRAEEELARWRAVTLDAARTLVAAPDLTDAGRTIANRMHELLTSWQHEPLDESTERRAAAVGAAHRTRWRLTHLRPDGDVIDALAHAWLRGEPPAVEQVPVTLERSKSPLFEPSRSPAERPEVIAALSDRLCVLAGDMPPADRLARWLGDRTAG
jgi:hypothetical protein